MPSSFLQQQPARLPHLVHPPCQSPFSSCNSKEFPFLVLKTKGRKTEGWAGCFFFSMCEEKEETPCSFFPLSCSILYNWRGVSILSILQRQQRRTLLALHKGSTGKGIQHRKESISREDQNSQRVGKICIVLIWLLTLMKSKQTFINRPFHTSSALSSWAQHRETDYSAVTLRSFLCLS